MANDRHDGRSRACAPEVSIVIDNFNYGRYVGAAIRSALEQSLADVEVIVVDDGSTDNSRQVIESFGDRVRAVFQPNGGQTSALNAGFDRSRADVVIFLDADDLLLPGAAARARSTLRATGCVKAHWPLWVIDTDGRRTGELKPAKRLVEGDLRDLLIRSGPVHTEQAPTSGNAWSRRLLEEVMPLPELDDRHGADSVLRQLAPIYGAIARVDEPQGCYRRHRDNFGAVGARERALITLRRYPVLCRVLASHLERQGIAADTAAWSGPGSEYAWISDAVGLDSQIGASIPRGEAFVLIDGGGLGQEFFPHHTVLAVPQRDGAYSGAPVDDIAACAELERVVAAGVEWLVLAFPALWWRESYPGLFEAIESRAIDVRRGDKSIIWRWDGARRASTSLSGRRQACEFSG
jgi:hypothetical protein